MLAGGGLHVETVASGDRFRVADTVDVLVVGDPSTHRGARFLR
jgi:hypothetical protein